MLNFAFISRHVPNADQIQIAADMGITITHIGDADAFTVVPGFVDQDGAFDGVIVVHPAAAMRLASSFMVGVFKNSQRSDDGGKLTFVADSLHVFNLVD